MKISCQCGYFMKKYGMAEGIRLLGTAGFDAVDFSMNAYPYDAPLFHTSEKEFVSCFSGLHKQIKSYGMFVGQTHAVVPSYRRDEQVDREIFDTIVRNIQATALLDCRYIVIHPKIPSEYKYDNFRAETRELNKEFYSALLPYLKKYGVVCLVENMFSWDSERGRICPTVCSYAAEMNDYIDMVDNEWLAACLDVGHGNLTLDPPVHMIAELGSRIKALHIHDNDGISDQHLCPYLGTIDWDSIASALSAAGYCGTFNLEAEKTFYYNQFFEADSVNIAKQMYLVACKIAEKIKN